MFRVGAGDDDEHSGARCRAFAGAAKHAHPAQCSINYSLPRAGRAVGLPGSRKLRPPPAGGRAPAASSVSSARRHAAGEPRAAQVRGLRHQPGVWELVQRVPHVRLFFVGVEGAGEVPPGRTKCAATSSSFLPVPGPGAGRAPPAARSRTSRAGRRRSPPPGGLQGEGRRVGLTSPIGGAFQFPLSRVLGDVCNATINIKLPLLCRI
jgi:hypothetical protein